MLSRLVLRGIDAVVASESKGTRTRREVLVALREHLTPETKVQILARLPPERPSANRVLVGHTSCASGTPGACPTPGNRPSAAGRFA